MHTLICGGCELKVDDSLSISIRSYLEEMLTDFASKYDYLEYRNTNQSLSFDFTYIEDSIFKLMFFDSKIKLNYLDPIVFEFELTNLW